MPKRSHVFLGWTNPTSDFRQLFFFWEKSKNKGKWPIMKKNSFLLYGNPMYSNFDFMINDNNSLYF